jgi:endo-1,4-beta-xylanase
MHSRSKLLIGIVTTTLAALGAGCSNDESGDGTSPSSSAGSGGSLSSGSAASQVGGTTVASSSAAGGSQSSGGASSSSSVAPSAGSSAVGGSSSTGGKSSNSTAVTGGSSGGTSTGGTGGRSGVTTGGTGTATGGGSTVRGGSTANGGATGGSSSGGGATSTLPPGSVAFPEKFVGNIDTNGRIRDDFSKYWNQFSPENAGKWGSVQGSNQTTFNWNSLDTMYKYANDNKITFKQHCFVWGSQQPNWVNDSNGEAAVKNWISNFCQRYPNTKIIDVVNEPPPHTTPKYKNGIGGDGTSGWDWIANAFKWARESCPTQVLVLNDYNNDELSSDAKHTSDIVNAIKKVGAPINAVGCQTHGASNTGSASLKTNIDTIVKNTGLPVYITEYDIAQANDQTQLQRYQDHIQMFWNHPDIKGITIWGYIVGSTWVANTGIMQSSGTMRPAMTWLMDFLKRGN